MKVQGSELRALDDMLLITSGGRYKLFTEGCDYVRVLEGKGHVKWARGEYPFSEGDILRLDGVKEYELNRKEDTLSCANEGAPRKFRGNFGENAP